MFVILHLKQKLLRKKVIGLFFLNLIHRKQLIFYKLNIVLTDRQNFVRLISKMVNRKKVI